VDGCRTILGEEKLQETNPTEDEIEKGFYFTLLASPVTKEAEERRVSNARSGSNR